MSTAEREEGTYANLTGLMGWQNSRKLMSNHLFKAAYRTIFLLLACVCVGPSLRFQDCSFRPIPRDLRQRNLLIKPPSTRPISCTQMTTRWGKPRILAQGVDMAQRFYILATLNTVYVYGEKRRHEARIAYGRWQYEWRLDGIAQPSPLSSPLTLRSQPFCLVNPTFYFFAE